MPTKKRRKRVRTRKAKEPIYLKDTEKFQQEEKDLYAAIDVVRIELQRDQNAMSEAAVKYTNTLHTFDALAKRAEQLTALGQKYV